MALPRFGCEPINSELFQPIVLGGEGLSDISDADFVIVVHELLFGFAIVLGGQVDIGAIGFVNPGYTCLFEIAFQVSFLLALEQGLAPVTIHELGFDHVLDGGLL